MTISEISFVEEGNYLILLYTMTALLEAETSKTIALVDSSASSYFINYKFAHGVNLYLK